MRNDSLESRTEQTDERRLSIENCDLAGCNISNCAIDAMEIINSNLTDFEITDDSRDILKYYLEGNNPVK